MGKVSLQSRFRVSGFGFRVSGFGFRVSIGPGESKSSESVSGFGFRVSIGSVKSSESVSGFGFRVSQFETNFNSRFRVSGFGFRVSLVETNSADLSPDHVSSETTRGTSLVWQAAAGHWLRYSPY